MYQAPPGAVYEAPKITVEGESLKAVRTFKYLGSVVNDNNSMDAEITRVLLRLIQPIMPLLSDYGVKEAFAREPKSLSTRLQYSPLFCMEVRHGL